MTDRTWIIMDTEIGMIAGKIVGWDDEISAYIVSFNGTLIRCPKEYCYEYEGQLYIQGHDTE